MTIAAPTAASLLRQLDAHRTQVQITALTGLDAVAQAEVRRALRGVKGSARIDVDLLIGSVRRDIAERAEREAQREPDVLGILQYRLSLMTQGELVEMRDDLRARVAAGEGDQPLVPAITHASVPVGGDDDLDDELDDEADDPPRRRSIQRIPSRRAAASSRSPRDPANPAQKQEQRVSSRISRSLAGFLGPRLLGPGADLDPYYVPMPPPWLLPDEEPDAEKADVAIEARADAY